MPRINSLLAGRGDRSTRLDWEDLEGLGRKLCGPGAMIVYQTDFKLLSSLLVNNEIK